MNKNCKISLKHLKLKIYIILVILLPCFFLTACYFDKEAIVYPGNANCDTTNITYSSSVIPIVRSHCYSCHGASKFNSLGANINLEGYSNLTIPANNGTLMKSIEHQAGASPMPKNASKLSDCDITTIRLWINSGSPNN
jgi:hypothetical protein